MQKFCLVFGLSMLTWMIFFFSVGLLALASPASDGGIYFAYSITAVFMVLSVLCLILSFPMVLWGDGEDKTFGCISFVVIPALFMLFPLWEGDFGCASNAHKYVELSRVHIVESGDGSSHFFVTDKHDTEISVYTPLNRILGKNFSTDMGASVNLKTVGYVKSVCWDNHGICRVLNSFSDYRRYVVEVRDAKTQRVLGNLVVYRESLLMAKSVVDKHNTTTSETEFNTVNQQVQASAPIK